MKKVFVGLFRGEPMYREYPTAVDERFEYHLSADELQRALDGAAKAAGSQNPEVAKSAASLYTHLAASQVNRVAFVSMIESPRDAKGNVVA